MNALTPRPARRPRRIAIIGAGFSGTLCAIQLKRQLAMDDRVLLIERGAAHGPGLAYGSADPRHLLNVPAAGMSAFPDQPEHFLRWLGNVPKRDFGPFCVGPAAEAFVPRMLYGRYLRGLLDHARGEPGAIVERHKAEVADVMRLPNGGFHLRGIAGDGEGWAVDADAVVLAIGNPPPDAGAPPHLYGDPWHPEALAGIDPEAPVLLIGTGLTMADLVVSLRKSRGHRGPIIAVSRRGWLPLAHATPLPKVPWQMPPLRGRATLSELARLVRRAMREATAQGAAWQSVADAVRPQLQRLWLDLPSEEKARFLRHGRTPWNIHRHRVAPVIAKELAEAVADGQLQVKAGRLAGWEPDGAGVRATLRCRDGATREVQAARILLCTGPGSGFAWTEEKPLAAMAARGLLRHDRFELGLDLDPASLSLIGASGRITRGLFAIGPLTRSVFWEATAVPELRAQAAHLAAAAAYAAAAAA